MSLILVETAAEQPITFEWLSEADQRISPCLQEREATWQYSLLSSDRHRMICVYDAPDAEALRTSYRKANLGFGKMYPIQMIYPSGGSPARNERILKVFEGTYPEGFTDEAWNEALRLISPCYDQAGVEWIHSHVSLDGTRVVCELNAVEAEIIREAHRKAGISFDCVWSAQLLKPGVPLQAVG